MYKRADVIWLWFVILSICYGVYSMIPSNKWSMASPPEGQWVCSPWRCVWNEDN